MSPLLTGILDFTRMTHALREVRRSCLYSDNLVGENDLEHGYQLALLCRYIYDTMHLSLDLSRILRYALTHDIVEVYAGDTLPFDSLGVLSKDDRENEVLHRLEKEFPQMQDMRLAIHEYKDKSTIEATFVYAIDKLIPEFNVFVEGGQTYTHYDIPQEGLTKHMTKAYIYEDVRSLADECIEIVKNNPQWFTK